MEEGSRRTIGAPRRPFQGVLNILRFNWHFFVLAGGGVAALALASATLEGAPRLVALGAFGLRGGSVLVSLLVSSYVYDFSGLYRLEWLTAETGLEEPGGPGEPASRMANIHAGFDETSALLRARYPAAAWTVMDFYDPAKHTEASISRARRAYPPSPEDLRVDTSELPISSSSMDAIFVVLAAHEIRDADERQAFFEELHRVLKPHGSIILVEHLRDWPNLLAYTAGAFHFVGRAAWLAAFENARLRVSETLAPNRFMACFVLVKIENTP